MSAGAIEAALSGIVSRRTATLVGGLLGGLTYDLVNVCDSDPPADPGLTAQDIADALNLYNPFVSIPAQQKLQQWFTRIYWYAVCDCVATTTPSLPTPSDPGDTAGINPGLPSGPQGAFCWDITVTLHVPTPQTVNYDFTEQLLPAQNLDPSFAALAASGIPNMARVPSGATTMYAVTTIDAIPAAGDQSGVCIQFYNAANSALVGYCIADFIETSPSTTQTSAPLAIPATATHWIAQGNSSTVAHNIAVQLRVACAGDSADAPVTPCCPPDPALALKLEQILAMVTLIQRQIAPFAYVIGTAHAGLTGHGHFSVQGLIGVLVEITAGSQVSEEDGDPTTVWSAGWISFGSAAGNSERIFISTSPQTCFVEAAGQYTRIGYTLRPNVTATITELVREP